MPRQKVQPTARQKRRTESHAAVVPQGYELVRVPQEKPEKRNRNDDVVSRSFRFLWRHRWQWTPAAAFGAVVWAAVTSPAAAAIACGVLFGSMQFAAKRMAEDFRGQRKWLSTREREIVSMWAVSAGAWSVTVLTGAWAATNPIALAVLGALTVVQSVQWWASRRIRRQRKAKLSKRAKELQAKWAEQIGVWGPTPLKGSKILPGSMADLPGESLTFRVRLLNGHADHAVTDDVRRALEVLYKLGIGTVHLQKVREDAALVDITLTPERHLEKVEAPWPGPVLRDNGEIEFAVTYSRDIVCLRLYDKDGVKHLVIVGATGGGKSVSLTVAVLAGALAGRTTVWYADGGGGDSAPWLAGACDWWAVGGVEEWKAMIQAAIFVAKARGARRGAQGIGSWRGKAETDPILTLVFDEATAIARQLGDQWHQAVLELAELGRKRGIQVIQVSQDARVDRWIGGGIARDQMRQGGAMVGHAVGSGTASLLAVGGTSDPVDLTDLPEEPGFAHIIRQGKVLPLARVLHATEAKVLAELEGFTPRGLSKEDQVAAGDAYRQRVRGADAAAAMRGEFVEPTNEELGEMVLRIPEPMILRQAESEAPMDRALNSVAQANKAAADLARMTVLHTLMPHPDGLPTADVAKATGNNERTARRYLDALREAEKVTYDPVSKRWSTVQEAVSA